MACKVFVSFLGFSNYDEGIYYKDDFQAQSARFIQAATLEYLQTKETWTADDVAYILLTKGAEEKNWVDDGQVDRDTKQIIKQKGLNSVLSARKYPFPIETVRNLPDGNNEEEVFTIFSRVFNVLQEGDQLYFDVTHGFRSLPMLALVMTNYAKFLKNITVQSITYGNWEARKKREDERFYAPIIDLLPLSQIQDWTFAAADFLKNGNADRFAELAEEKGDEGVQKLSEALSVVTKDFQTCRGMNILYPQHISSLKKVLQDTEKNNVSSPINQIIEKVDDAFSPFSTENDSAQIANGFEAAKWCLEHRLYQQAATILQENVISYFCVQLNVPINDEALRTKVSRAINHALHLGSKMSESKKQKKWEQVRNEELEQYTQCALEIDREIIKKYSNLSDIRNDFNHSGMREEPESPDKICDNIKEIYNELRCLNLTIHPHA